MAPQLKLMYTSTPFFGKNKGLKISPQILGNILSDALLRSHFKIPWLTSQNCALRSFFGLESWKLMMRTFNHFLPETLDTLTFTRIHIGGSSKI